MDVEILSRLQFAGTIMFHYLFPPLSIGLGLQLFLCELAYFRTRKPEWEIAARFWTRVFAVNFAMGVSTGIVMEFEFGTNWAAYSRFVGDVFGSALAAEGIFAFFLESGFLAILVFGWDRVKPPLHLFSTLMVFMGSVFSAVWIVIANSWQQTPAGYHIVWHDVQGTPMPRAEITDFWAMVFNPSSVDRLTHTLTGALVLGAFFVASVCSYYVLKGRHLDIARRCLSIALPSALAFTFAAAMTGHDAAQKLVETQPAKLAAMEAHFETSEEPTGLYLFGWPDAENKTVHFGLQLPRLLSFLVYNNFSDPVPGMDQIPESDRPPIWLPFQTFHLMVGLGSMMIAVAGLSVLFWYRGTFEEKRWLLWTIVAMPIAAMIANQAGWITAEVGRQPWIVYPSVQDGVAMMGLRTSEGLSESVTADQVVASIVLFGIIYALLFAVWIFVLNHKIQHGPETVEQLAELKARHRSEGMQELFEQQGQALGGHLMGEDSTEGNDDRA
ncbi:cytochrome ubiquinol oxidase subunit I [Rhodopirellula sp. MGV]|uniref:cytochrome ubiquinol oxidase subunit I n=1 Tax=Rhodopirellula sp. MGV TaxID=2023130 RepID=UPI000B96C233|nr:cytochrome ubiquinol oxidase subunit I [Rhodopirellula sp. MGV]OYP28837.1 cytochrome ubiquinol oxidase subunit I [Rhodopirellula sp. MGV]PNY37557.1 cytochrome ubiquinol oxidase subunit I [Rhodopirellula baltica]